MVIYIIKGIEIQESGLQKLHFPAIQLFVPSIIITVPKFSCRWSLIYVKINALVTDTIYGITITHQVLTRTYSSNNDKAFTLIGEKQFLCTKPDSHSIVLRVI